MPLIVTAECLPILCCCCCRTKTHPTWNLPFELAVTILRASAVNIGRCWCVLRCLTDPPLGVVPTWLPFLPSNIGVVTNTTAPHGGEWVYPKDLQSTKGTCCAPCCCEIPGNPQTVSQKYKVLIVLIVSSISLFTNTFFFSFFSYYYNGHDRTYPTYPTTLESSYIFMVVLLLYVQHKHIVVS